MDKIELSEGGSFYNELGSDGDIQLDCGWCGETIYLTREDVEKMWNLFNPSHKE
jgi:hypothetical protein